MFVLIVTENEAITQVKDADKLRAKESTARPYTKNPPTDTVGSLEYMYMVFEIRRKCEDVIKINRDHATWAIKTSQRPHTCISQLESKVRAQPAGPHTLSGDPESCHDQHDCLSPSKSLLE